ncbi:AI-2E family transporter [Candidatus Poribacteria bacterium]|nr:AI-2E family transporter [Candidatus Poribacteria bacterium]
MNSRNDITPRQSGISGETALAIISVALAALWIAFAFYHGTSPDTNGNRILLLHPLVPIALIALLIRIYRWVDIKFVVQLEIIMIGLWLFVRMLGVLMPFILGFGFAYLFRFLWRALPFKKYYQRAIATVLIVLVCSGVLILTGFRVSNQVGQMAKGLQKFYHESLLPLVVGEEFTAFVSDVSGETETFYLGTNHGIYFYQINKDVDANKENKDVDANKENTEPERNGITNGELVGKPIQTIAVSDKFIYAGTKGGVYRCSKKIVKVAMGETEDSLITPTEDLIWTKINATRFDNQSIQSVNIPSWDSSLIYVGTETGLYKGVYTNTDSIEQWSRVAIDGEEERPIVSINSIDRFERARRTRSIYVVSTTLENKKTEQVVQQTDQQRKTNTNGTSQSIDNTEDTAQDSTSIEKEIDERPNNDEKQEEITTATLVHRLRHSANSVAMGWEPLNEGDVPTQEIKILAPTDKSDIKLYAGTVDGLYERYEQGSKEKWRKMSDSDRLPRSISLLVSVPSGLYAGNSSVIHHSPNNTSAWEKFALSEQGILIYRDDPYVKQFQEYLTKKIPSWTASGGAFIRWLSGLAGSIAFQFGGFIATVFLAFIVFVYASQGFDKYFRGFISLVPEKHQETAMAYLREIDRNMHQFLKGQFTVIVIISIISCIVYRIIGVPFALLVGILAGLCNAIPTFGPFIGGGFAYIAMLMGLAASDFSSTGFLIRCVFVLGAILGIQTIDNSLISPKVMSNAVDVDPLLIMFSVIVGASILGFWGVLLAIPIIVVIKSIIAVSKSAANDADAQPAQEPS